MRLFSLLPHRIPFYYLFKMLFLLYLALPQTQGTSYLYQIQLEPVLHEHKPQIDAALVQLRARVFAFLQAQHCRQCHRPIVSTRTRVCIGGLCADTHAQHLSVWSDTNARHAVVHLWPGHRCGGYHAPSASGSYSQRRPCKCHWSQTHVRLQCWR